MDQEDIGIALLSHLESCTCADSNHFDFITRLLFE
jgi:hypothetical protein